MELIPILLALLCIFWIVAGAFNFYHWLSRKLEPPAQRALRERRESEARGRALAEMAEREAEMRRQEREVELNEMRERWALYQNVFRVRALNELGPQQFESLVAGFFESKLYDVDLVGGSGDFGVDLIARKGDEILAVQVKRHVKDVGPSAIQQAHSGGIFQRMQRVCRSNKLILYQGRNGHGKAPRCETIR